MRQSPLGECALRARYLRKSPLSSRTVFTCQCSRAFQPRSSAVAIRRGMSGGAAICRAKRTNRPELSCTHMHYRGCIHKDPFLPQCALSFLSPSLCRTGRPRNARVATRDKLGALSIIFRPCARFSARLRQFTVDIGISPAGSFVAAMLNNVRGCMREERERDRC